MVPSFKGFELVAVLSLILAFQPIFCGHTFAAAAATSAPPSNSTSAHGSGTTSPPASTRAPSSPSSSSSAATTSPATASNSSSSSAVASSTSSALPVPAPPPLKPGQLPNSFPQNASVTSETNFNSSWQDFYLVTQGLPNITFPLGNNYAGNIPVGRSGHPNNTIFFWGFENNIGSLTALAGQIELSPWLIWLGGGGGPGSSGLLTSMIANGPMLLHNDFTVSQNSKSLTTLIDTFWVDQPVGAGFSTVDSDGYAKDENDVTNDFIGFLSNLVKIFPSLATRPLYLAGEDYASIYISYISKALMTSSNSPVMLQKIAIGNGMFYDPSVSANLATLSIAESFPQLIKFEQSTFAAFQSKSHLCGYDVNLTYPQQSVLPSIQSADRISPVWKSVAARETTDGLLQRRRYSPLTTKRQSLSLSDALDPNYGCSLFDELVDYAGNFSFPWTPGVFDLYDVADVVQPQPSIDGGIYFNSLQVRGALHGPFSKNWTSIDQYPFGSTLNFSSATNFFGDPSPPPATFFQDLVNAAASKNVELVLYSSGNNAIAHHRSLEILIQNTTFGGTRGFTRKPSTHWVDDNGNVAGIVHQERGIVYALFDNIGSLTPFTNPTAAYTFFRQFVLSSNTTGSITVDSKNHVVVLGGEDPDAADDAPRVASEIFLGATTTQSTLVAPSATIAAWVGFLENATGGAQASTSGADSRLALSAGGLWLGVLGTLGVAWAL